MTSNAVYLFIYSGKVSNLFPFLICNFFGCLVWMFYDFYLFTYPPDPETPGTAEKAVMALRKTGEHNGRKK